MAYPQCMAEGWPIGSGMMERANKVVEDRLKGAGMHWAEANVNPMLALRNAVCNERWEEVGTEIEREQRSRVAERRQMRCRSRAAAQVAEAAAAPPPAPARQRVRPLETEVKSLHPWKRPWSIRRQRELAGSV